jgi:hypothetical protein
MHTPVAHQSVSERLIAADEKPDSTIERGAGGIRLALAEFNTVDHPMYPAD